MKEVIVHLEIKINTNKDSNEILSALKRGIYRGLDTEPNYIAQPKDVQINQISYNESPEPPNKWYNITNKRPAKDERITYKDNSDTGTIATYHSYNVTTKVGTVLLDNGSADIFDEWR